jgi:CBS domain-containing protein
MKAREIMTRDVVAARPETPTREVAQLLVDNGISAVPVVDDRGAPIGMVSEGDLLGRHELSREARRDWWLAMLAEGETLDPDFLENLRGSERLARDVMAGPVVTVSEDTEVGEIARLLQTYRIKRVPVTREGRVVGIVSRADLLRALAGQSSPTPPHKAGLLTGALAGLDARFGLHRPLDLQTAPAHPEPSGEPPDPGFRATDFRKLVEDFEHKQDQKREEAQRVAVEQRRQRLGQLIDQHISDQDWRDILHRARRAAENGENEILLLRFPSHLCGDGGRAINMTEPEWPTTLRGEAAELYLRFERDLKPRGFHLTAQVLDFPGGVPGDIGLFLIWG